MPRSAPCLADTTYRSRQATVTIVWRTTWAWRSLATSGLVLTRRRCGACSVETLAGVRRAVIGQRFLSTGDQDLTGQIDALRAAGAGAIYREKISGARADRPELTKLMKVLAPGDVVLV